MNTYHHVPAGHTITVTIVDGTGFARQSENPAIAGIVSNANPQTFGPYPFDRGFVVQGNVSVSIAESDFAELIRDIPTVDPADDGVSVWNDSGVLKVSGPSEE